MPRDQVLRIADGLAVADDDEPRAGRDPDFGRDRALGCNRHCTKDTGRLEPT
jgi:hypothetical protein